MRQLANRIAHWNLYTGFRLLILPVAFVLAHWSPVIECLFVPHLEMRSWPLLAAYTSSKRCYCSGCIPEALLTYSSPYSAENIPDCSPLRHSVQGLPICSVISLECLHTVQCCQVIKLNDKELHTNAAGWNTLSLEIICYLLKRNITFSVV